MTWFVAQVSVLYSSSLKERPDITSGLSFSLRQTETDSGTKEDGVEFEAAEVLEKLGKLQKSKSEYRKAKADLEKQLVLEEIQILESQAVERKKRIRS